MNKINAVTEKDAVVTRLSPLLRSRGYGEPGYEANRNPTRVLHKLAPPPAATFGFPRNESTAEERIAVGHWSNYMQ